jgi:hypothetical protein
MKSRCFGCFIPAVRFRNNLMCYFEPNEIAGMGMTERSSTPDVLAT